MMIKMVQSNHSSRTASKREFVHNIINSSKKSDTVKKLKPNREAQEVLAKEYAEIKLLYQNSSQ